MVVMVAVGGTTLVITRAEFSFLVVQLAAASAKSTMRARVVMVVGLLLVSLVARGRRGCDDGLRTVDDARRDEDEQLGAVVGDRLLLEQPPKDRDLREHRNLVPRLGV